MLKEFRVFIMRGNIVDLAVAVVLGVAFGAVVTAFVNSLIMPLIGMLFGEPSFNDLSFTINESIFGYGSFLTAVMDFVLIAAAIFFFVVKPISSINKRMAKEGKATERDCPACLTSVPVEATRCSACTGELTPTV